MKIREQLNELLDSVDNRLEEAQRMSPRASRPLNKTALESHVHLVNWWIRGGGDHPDLGWTSGMPEVMDWQADQILAMGGTGVNCLFSGRNHVNASAAISWKGYCKDRNMRFSVMWDKQDECTPDDVKWLMDNLVGDGTVLFVFDDPTPEQLNALGDKLILYRNSNGLSKPRSLGCFGWPAFGAETQYREYFAKQVRSTNKIVVPHVSPGGGGAPWNKPGAITYWREGQEWRECLDWARTVCASAVNPVCTLLIASGDDFQENTAVLQKYLL